MSKLGSHLFGRSNVMGRLFSLLVEIVQNRLKVLSLEIQEEKIHFIQILILAIFTVFLAALTIVVVTVATIYVIAVEYRLLALLIAGGVFFVATAVLGLALVRKLSRHPIPFTHALTEMARRDE